VCACRPRSAALPPNRVLPPPVPARRRRRAQPPECPAPPWLPRLVPPECPVRVWLLRLAPPPECLARPWLRLVPPRPVPRVSPGVSAYRPPNSRRTTQTARPLPPAILRSKQSSRRRAYSHSLNPSLLSGWKVEGGCSYNTSTSDTLPSLKVIFRSL
jgi:hypothetical protein